MKINFEIKEPKWFHELKTVCLAMKVALIASLGFAAWNAFIFWDLSKFDISSVSDGERFLLSITFMAFLIVGYLYNDDYNSD